MTFRFELLSRPAGPVGPRRGRLHTAHGTVETPVFMPVGTLATVKALLPDDVRATGAEMLLVNAYHLSLRPGAETVASLGGVHHFMDWHRPILSDSGGFQVFSLARIRKVSEEGVRFRSHHDGSEHFFTPEKAMEVQRALAVDIAMPLDHVVPGDAPSKLAREAAERTVRWYERCRAAADGLTTFAIVQGATDPELRRWHAQTLRRLDAPGYSIGGLSVGESKDAMWAMTEVVCGELPLDRPRYLMGVGSPEDLVEGVARGVDMFDCVLPTRLGRNGALFTRDGRANIRNARWTREAGPVDAGCDCLACTRFSAAYLHHLFRNAELLGYRLATIHNVRFLVRLMVEARQAIEVGAFEAWAEAFRTRYRPTDHQSRVAQRREWEASRQGG
ncbi:MAG: tRNA guanosine(34) transglycosylase Tgt [Dehalococcoidia bacterium]